MERVRAAEPKIKFWRSSQRRGKLLHEFIESRLIDFARQPRVLAHEAEFLQRNVQKMIGVLAHKGDRAQCAPKFIECRLHGLDRDPDRDESVDARRM